MKTSNKRCLISAMFDCDGSIIQPAVVTILHNLDHDTVTVSCRYGLYDLSLYDSEPELNEILSLISSKLKAFQFCYHTLKKLLPSYGGDSIITDFYLSAYFESILYDRIGVINLDSPDPTISQYQIN